MAMAFLLLPLSGEGAAPDTAHLFPSQKKQVRSRDKHPLVGDKGCLPRSFFVGEEF